ncbi:MAG: division plane positioning ATPase MipZ [Fimbriimonadaceae bacterium]|nr:division plane positioning ATPase MipZ [Alphaproteobacteria bacterium]
MQAAPENTHSAHIIVFGNEKGGTGKSTTCMQVLVSLLQAGQRVASIDLDSRQGTLTAFIENRKAWATRMNLDLAMPRHFSIHEVRSEQVAHSEEAEFAAFAAAINDVEHQVDFIVIDTPASDSYLMRLAHTMADTLVSPLNDSLIDFDVLAKVDPISMEILGISHYARMVREGRRQRRILDIEKSDWVVVRNRISREEKSGRINSHDKLHELSRRLGFRISDPIAERAVFRDLFLKGLTALDLMDEETLGVEPELAHLAARQEIRALMADLKLPINATARDRMLAKLTWDKTRNEPLDLDDILDI